MPIIQQAQQQAQAAPAPPAQDTAQMRGQAPAGPQQLSESGKDVLIAVYGMLYDKRVAVGEKLAEQIKSSRDPVAIIAHSAYDLVKVAAEKVKVQLDEAEFRAVVKVALLRIGEIAKAVGMTLSADDAKDAMDMLSERHGGQQPQQPQPGQQPPEQQPQQEMQ